MLSLFGALLAFIAAWLLFRNADPRDRDAWDGIELGLMAELLASKGSDMAQPLGDLWNLAVERQRNLADDEELLHE